MKKITLLFFFIPLISIGQNSQQKKSAQGLLILSEELYKQKDYDSSFIVAKECYDLVKRHNNDTLFISSSLALIRATVENNIDSRGIHFNLAKNKAIKTENWGALAETYYTMGKVLYTAKEHGAALPFYLKVDSLASAKGLKNEIVIKSILDRSEISRTTFTHDGVELAHDLQEEALKLAKEINSEELIHDIYLRLADMYGLKDNFPETKKYTDLAFAYYKKEDNVERMSRAYLTYMNYYYGIEDYDNAGKKLEEGIAYLKTKDSPEKLARMIVAYGTFFRKRKNDCANAILQFEIAKKIYQQLDSKLSLGYMYLVEGLALCNGELKNFEKGYEYYQETYITKRELVKKANNDLSRKLETKYQAEKKEQEIALLNSQNELTEQKRKNQRNLLLGGLGLMSIAGIFLFFQFKNRNKTNIKLRELDKAKSTFFANISHEFRTPLTLIKGPIEDQLALTPLNQSSRKNLLSAQRNTIRLENLVEQLLALSKLESGHFNLQIEPGNFPQFLGAQTEAFSFSCHEKGIDYKVAIEHDKLTDWFDRDALEKMLFNLIGNALKYTPEQGKIIITGKRENNKYLISIKNSGENINPKQLSKLFDRFYKADIKSTGTGIGLSLTQELAELHHGNISVNSKVGELTEFILEIPVLKSEYSTSEIISEEFHEVDRDTLIPSEEIVENIIPTSEDAPILLIVDDAIDIRNYICSIFETAYVVHQAENGKEGFSKALEIIPDLIISDVMMPEDDGFTFTKNLKENELTGHIPVILLTAKSEVTDKLEGMEIGADSYITKPFSSQLVRATAENLIENRRKLQQRFSQEVILTPKDIAISSADQQFLERLQKVLDNKITNPDFTIEEFGKEMMVSRMQLHRKLKALTGQSTSEFLRSQRLKLASNLLKTNKISISEVGYTVGFNDPSYFAKCFKQEYGCSPTEFINAS